jgi:hypothetical protein
VSTGGLQALEGLGLADRLPTCWAADGDNQGPLGEEVPACFA